MTEQAAQPNATSARIEFSKVAEQFTKFTATIVVLVYSCGFLITSLYHAKFGYTAISPFRPRILAAGTWFLVFLVLPIFGARFQITRRNNLYVRATPFEKDCIFLVNYYAGCTGIAFILSLIFDTHFASWDTVSSIAGLISVTTVGALYKSVKRSNVTTVTALILLLGMNVISIASLIRAKEFGVQAVTLWFFLVGAFSWLYEETSQTAFFGRIQEHWSSVVSVTLALLLLFSTIYYAHISASWGGGTPTPVTIYFSKDSRILPNQSLSTHLIDESDAGYFVLNTTEKKAIFLPRTAVALAYFSDKQLDPKMLAGTAETKSDTIKK